MLYRKIIKPFVSKIGDSKRLLGDDLSDNVKKVKATHSMNQSISNKRLRLSSSSAGNSQSHYSSNSKATLVAPIL